jgi:hypothetical protein
MALPRVPRGPQKTLFQAPQASSAPIRELDTVGEGHDGSKIPASNLEACS